MNKILIEYMNIRNSDSVDKANLYDMLNDRLGKPYKNGRSLAESCRYKLNKMHDTRDLTFKVAEGGVRESVKLIRRQDLVDHDALLQAHGFKPGEWEVVNSRVSEWDVHKKGGGSDVFYSHKLTVKPIQKVFDPNKIYEDLIKKPTTHKNITPAKSAKGDKYMLEVAFQDFHLGKLSWSKESGSDFDYKIAIKRAKDTVSDIINRAKIKGNVERVLFLIGGDMFHSDSIKGATTAGTQMDNDIRWQKMFIEGTNLLVSIINSLGELAPVDVVTILGNHDTQTLMHAQVVLSAYYRNDPNVRVDMKMTTRKYYKYGECLIGFTHGDKEGKRMLSSMQVEAAEMWGKTKFREIHAGHLHSEQTSETNGAILRNISSITETDAWHHQKGYVGAQRKLQSFLWHKRKGLLEIWNSPILDDIKERAESLFE